MTIVAPLAEHLRRAEFAWDCIAKHAVDLERPAEEWLRLSLRMQAIRHAPLYPIIEAQRGEPL